MDSAADNLVASTGLTLAEVDERLADGRSNQTPDPIGRTFLEILRANALTPVNAIMVVLYVLILISGNWKDGLFVGVVVSNTIVGVTQESRARRELQKLQVLTEPRATVIRAGSPTEIDAENVVLDDLVVLTPGSQVPVDGEIVAVTGLHVDESMLTGESEPVLKSTTDRCLSGSFILSGSGRMIATAVGADSYAAGLATEAKTFSAVESTLRQSINRILKWLTIIIPLASVLLFRSLLKAEDRWQDALQGTVAAAVAMVPDGLVLLTSLAFVAGVLKLSRQNALAKQLSTVEVLARVDVLCLDKTGTITSGNIQFTAVHPLGVHTIQEATNALVAMAAVDDAPNATMIAIAKSLGDESDWTPLNIEPFSSARKWSAVEFAGSGWWYMGAPDILLADRDSGLELIERLSRDGQRLVALALSPTAPAGDAAPTDLDPVAIVELRDEIRPDANDTLAYFAGQGVKVKVISGDNAATVDTIARRAGLDPEGSPVDAHSLLNDSGALAASLITNDVFGRVAPHQKQDMVSALQSQGHVVAMTGDGVNDVLALKDADLGIAMGSGSAAARSVADLVLTDDSFATLPVVVNEGRKVINNVERVANLFVTKAVYAVLLTLAVGVIGSPFPFLPRQLTLIGTFSIGIPGFFLALSPEVSRVRSGFLDRVLRFSIPSGLIAGGATLAAYEFALHDTSITLGEARTLATITLLSIGLVILLVASRPLRAWKLALAASMAASYGLFLVVPAARNFFELDLFTDPAAWAACGLAIVVAGISIALVPRWMPGLSR